MNKEVIEYYQQQVILYIFTVGEAVRSTFDWWGEEEGGWEYGHCKKIFLDHLVSWILSFPDFEIMGFWYTRFWVPRILSFPDIEFPAFPKFCVSQIFGTLDFRFPGFWLSHILSFSNFRFPTWGISTYTILNLTDFEIPCEWVYRWISWTCMLNQLFFKTKASTPLKPTVITWVFHKEYRIHGRKAKEWLFLIATFFR